MWLVYAREPESDAPWWPGRRLLAAVDAVGWPLLWIELLANAPAPLGVVKPVVTAIALVYAIARLRRAVFVNHRYQLTTLWLGRVFAVLLLVGFILKLMMPG